MRMQILRALIAATALLGAPSFASAEPIDRAALDAAAAACVRNEAEPVSDVVGLSDPHALDPQVVDLIAETGVEWVRAELHWSRIEPEPDVPYRWDAYDKMIERFNAKGVRVLIILSYIPPSYLDDWPRTEAAFARFARAAMTRYAPRGVRYWEIFNEPNLPGYGWMTKDDDARANLAAYALLLARANRVLREVDPSGFIVLGGIASDQHRGAPLEEVMDALYGFGVKDCFDIMAFHPYGYQSRFPAARERVDAVLRKAGDAGKSVWFNEYGWTDYAEMDMAEHAGVGDNPMIAVFAQRRSADALFWFSAKDYSARWDAPTFGLATFDLKKRASFETFRRLVRAAQEDR